MERLKETKECLDFVISLGHALAASLQDGQLTVTDAINFWEPVSNLSDAIDGFDTVLDEIKSLDDDDFDHLYNYIIENFDIPSDQVEETLESGLYTVISILKFIQKL